MRQRARSNGGYNKAQPIGILPEANPGMMEARVTTSLLIEPAVMVFLLRRAGFVIFGEFRTEAGWVWHLEGPKRPEEDFKALIHRIKAKALKKRASTIPVQPADESPGS